MAVFVEQPLALPGSAKYTVYRKFTTKKHIDMALLHKARYGGP